MKFHEVKFCYTKIERYRAEDGQAKYKFNRENCGRKLLTLTREKFLCYVAENFRKNHWSLDACVGRALKLGIFKREEVVCTKTLYNYVELGLLNPIKNIDLPLKMRRKISTSRTRAHKKKLGRSIDERSEAVETREEFGHLECDLIDDVLLNIVERKTRYSFTCRLPDKKVSSVMNAFNDFRNLFGKNFDKVFRTITTDNGSELLPNSKKSQTSSCTSLILIHRGKKVLSKTEGGLFRRFIPKGKRCFLGKLFTKKNSSLRYS